jgi:hypothetical protein
MNHAKRIQSVQIPSVTFDLMRNGCHGRKTLNHGMGWTKAVFRLRTPRQSVENDCKQ